MYTAYIHTCNDVHNIIHMCMVEGETDFISRWKKLVTKTHPLHKLRMPHWWHINELETNNTSTGQPPQKFWLCIKNTFGLKEWVHPSSKLDGKLMTETWDQAETDPVIPISLQSCYCLPTWRIQDKMLFKERDNRSTTEDNQHNRWSMH